MMDRAQLAIGLPSNHALRFSALLLLLLVAVATCILISRMQGREQLAVIALILGLFGAAGVTIWMSYR